MEQPTQGGSYVRNGDGSLTLVESTGDAGPGSPGLPVYDGGGEAYSSAAYARQFRAYQRGLPTRRRIVTGSGQVHMGPCAVVGVHCIAKGSAGTATLHDAAAASDAALLRFSLAQAAAVDGTYYPQVAAHDRNAARLFSAGLYFTVTTGGAWAVDYVDGQAIAGVEGSGKLCAAQRMNASGVALAGPAYVASVQIIAPGSSGNFVVYDDAAATAGRELHPSIAFGSLTVNQLIEIHAELERGLYMTLPTSGIAIVNYLPR